MLCRKEMSGFKCSCGWKRVYHTFLTEYEEKTMEGVGSMVERSPGSSAWVLVPAGSMMVVDDVEVAR